MTNEQIQSSGRSTRWCFTINNAVANNIVDGLRDGIAYIIWQREKGAEGTEHLQGYVRWKTNVGLPKCRKVISDRGHFEIARGDEDANVNYCTKADTRVSGPWSFGERAAPGRRTDLAAAAAAVFESGTIDSVDPSLLVRYWNGFNRVASLKAPPMRKDLSVICLWGKSGVGKTYSVFESDPTVYRMVMGNAGSWWDGYTGQKTVLFDEFTGGIPLGKMLQFLDPYPLTLEIKGGTQKALFTRVFITCNDNPTTWYGGVLNARPTDHAALMRRIGCGPEAGDFEHRRTIECSSREQVAKDLTDAMATMPAFAELLRKPDTSSTTSTAPPPKKRQLDEDDISDAMLLAVDITKPTPPPRSVPVILVEDSDDEEEEPDEIEEWDDEETQTTINKVRTVVNKGGKK